MRLELKNNKTLTFTNEFNLTEKPLEVDMLIVHKETDVPIDNPIGEFFGKHNLLENEDMAASLFELMKPEIDKYAEEYAEEYANKRDIENVVWQYII